MPPSPAVRQVTADSKKEEFRKYLEKSGVIDAFTKGGRRASAGRVNRLGEVGRPFPGLPCRDALPLAASLTTFRFAVLVGLYEQPTRPANALEYGSRHAKRWGPALTPRPPPCPPAM